MQFNYPGVYFEINLWEGDSVASPGLDRGLRGVDALEAVGVGGVGIAPRPRDGGRGVGEQIVPLVGVPLFYAVQIGGN